jgi:hypothetical protein
MDGFIATNPNCSSTGCIARPLERWRGGGDHAGCRGGLSCSTTSWNVLIEGEETKLGRAEQR